MRQYKKFLYLFLSSLVMLTACRKETKDPEFGEGDAPRIFQLGDNFRTSYILDEGQSAKYSGLLFSPAGKVNISWKVNDVEKSKDTAFTFTPTGGGEFKITVEAEYKGMKTIRTSTVLVKPNTYTPAPFTKVVMAYLSETGLPSSVNWDFVTHVAYQSGRVSADGSLDITPGEVNQKMDELVARGHIHGKPVLLSLAGRLSGIDGWALYDSRDFGEVLRDAAKRSALIDKVKTYVVAKKLDGVDIIMTDFNGDPAYATNLSGLGSFVSGLRTALPAGALITVAVTNGWQHWDYPNLADASWVNVHAFEDGVHVGPGAPRGQASSYDYMLSAADVWKNFHVTPDKIVVGIPAFGLRYNDIDGAGNNLSWGSYDYVTYNGILALDPAAEAKEYVNSAKGIYYNGIDLVKKKAAFIKGSAYKGAYLWTIDYDSPVAGKSLVQALYTALK